VVHEIDLFLEFFKRRLALDFDALRIFGVAFDAAIGALGRAS
jgi:hypothetical protein